MKSFFFFLIHDRSYTILLCGARGCGSGVDAGIGDWHFFCCEVAPFYLNIHGRLKNHILVISSYCFRQLIPGVQAIEVGQCRSIRLSMFILSRFRNNHSPLYIVPSRLFKAAIQKYIKTTFRHVVFSSPLLAPQRLGFKRTVLKSLPRLECPDVIFIHPLLESKFEIH